MKKVVLLLVALVLSAAFAQQDLYLGTLVAANPKCEPQVEQSFLRGAQLPSTDKFLCVKLAPQYTMQDAAVAIDLDTQGLVTVLDWTAAPSGGYISVKGGTDGYLTFGLVPGYVFIVQSPNSQ